LKENYTHFLNVLAELDTTALSEADLLSMKVMKWDCEVKLGKNSAKSILMEVR